MVEFNTAVLEGNPLVADLAIGLAFGGSQISGDDAANRVKDYAQANRGNGQTGFGEIDRMIEHANRGETGQVRDLAKAMVDTYQKPTDDKGSSPVIANITSNPFEDFGASEIDDLVSMGVPRAIATQQVRIGEADTFNRKIGAKDSKPSSPVNIQTAIAPDSGNVADELSQVGMVDSATGRTVFFTCGSDADG